MNAITTTVGVTTLPRFIALCGNPKSGKSEVQKILHRHFGYEPVDDGHVLRQFAVEKLGLSWDDVQTQEGKARFTEILGKTWQNRDILGTLGNQLEDMFGEQIMPFIATRSTQPGGLYSFGSVRKTQGHFFKQHGGIVIEVCNPLAGPSPFAFDKFDASAVDHKIYNDALFRGLEKEVALIDLEEKVISAVNQLAVHAL